MSGAVGPSGTERCFLDTRFSEADVIENPHHRFVMAYPSSGQMNAHGVADEIDVCEAILVERPDAAAYMARFPDGTGSLPVLRQRECGR